MSGRSEAGLYRLGRNQARLEVSVIGTDDSELTPAIGKVARRELAVHGYLRYENLTEVSPSMLLAIHGVGPKAIGVLDTELARRGLSFAAD